MSNDPVAGALAQQRAGQPAAGWPPQQATWPNQPHQAQQAQQQASWPPRQAPGQREAWPAEPALEPERTRRGRFVMGLLIGLAAALLAAGPAGYFVAARTADEPSGPPTIPPTASRAPSLPPFEANQAEANRAKFSGELAALAESWLPWIGGCLRDTDPGGAKLLGGEKSRISCRSGGLGISFVLYNSIADRDAVRGHRERQNRESTELAPGAAAPSVKAGASGKPGDYVEYAFRDSAGRTICGIWWDRTDSLATAYVEAKWVDDLREKWEPLRDIWQRRS